MYRFKEICLAVLLSAYAGPMLAETGDCASLAGTYLTTKTDRPGVDEGVKGRTILTLTQGGAAFMGDSAQYGIEGYQAFGAMQGGWSCDGEGSFRATLLDFSYPDSANPDAMVGRIEISGTVDGSGGVAGQTEVNLFPLFSDPLSGAPPDVQVTYAFEGQRLELSPARQTAGAPTRRPAT